MSGYNAPCPVCGARAMALLTQHEGNQHDACCQQCFTVCDLRDGQWVVVPDPSRVDRLARMSEAYGLYDNDDEARHAD